jgi:steroid 5-alpha reductase family enzyme
MKIKYAINLHKGITFIFVLGLMNFYDNFSTAAWIYLALHGSYGLIWLLKDRIYPDPRWEENVSVGIGIFTLILLGLYWIAPLILISQYVEPKSSIIAVAIAINLLGVFLHYSSDAQKYFTLKYQPGLITEGFFARCRNTNYLGEILIYGSFALLSQHWLPFVILGFFVSVVFIPNMLKKDTSLSRYSEFALYKANSGMILPKIFTNTEQNI